MLTRVVVFILAAATLSLAAPPSEPSAKATTKELIKLLLDQDLGTRKFPFPDVVQAATGKKVLAVSSKNKAHQAILSAIRQSAKETIAKLSQPDSPVRKLRRINEASRFFEDALLEKINTQPQLAVTIPKNNKGKEQRSGYPDLLITHTDATGNKTHAYLDPKLFEEKSRSSSLRTFYYEPRKHTNKIQHDALHLLIGISHDGKQGSWTFTSFQICDLSHFHVRLKAEFQASNKDLYRPNIIMKSPNKTP